MKATETYLILCQMDAGEITLQEAHELILRLFDVMQSDCDHEDELTTSAQMAQNHLLCDVKTKILKRTSKVHLITTNVCAVVMFKVVHIVVTVALVQCLNVGTNIAQRMVLCVP